MTADVTPAPPPVAHRSRPWVLLAVLAAVTLIRLLQMRDGGSPDEGGFLVIGSQWTADGSSLYGDYWVDRPPLLITIFALADALGGLLALRLIGIATALAAIWLLASTARRLFGDRAGAWSALTAGALLVSPLYGAVDINGELLALPFLALGLRCAVEAVLNDDTRSAGIAAVGAGAAAVAAVLIKQNLADVVVFAAVWWLLSWRAGRLTGSRLLQLIGLAALGAVLLYGAVTAWALAHGTSPVDAFEATYPFRIEAGAVLAEDNRAESGARLGKISLAFLGSLVPVALAAFAVIGFRRRPAGAPDRAALGAVTALVGYGAFSVLAGGSYWFHYLLETVPAVALAAGAVALAAPHLVRPAVGAVVLSGLVAGVTVIISPTSTPASVIGQAIGAVAEPGDTIVATFGDAEMIRRSRLSSPYEYLWTLPARVRDPDLRVLRGVVSGPAAPAWIVVRDSKVSDRLDEFGVLEVMKQRYRVVGKVCGREVYLRNELQRAVPTASPGSDCTDESTSGPDRVLQDVPDHG